MGLAGLTWACSSPVAPVEEDLTQYVNPFIGTDFTGNTYPGAQVPFGMVQLSRTTAFRGGTESQAITIRTVPLPDFSHTHLSGTGAGDFVRYFFLCQ